jgi:hypothetical protein
MFKSHRRAAAAGGVTTKHSWRDTIIMGSTSRLHRDASAFAQTGEPSRAAKASIAHLKARRRHWVMPRRMDREAVAPLGLTGVGYNPIAMMA